MLTDNVIEFMNYKNALKGNYRKGVHTMRCILENPAQAADFAASVGAVSVVFGVPVDKPDRNSDELLELVLNSFVCDKATLTFLSQFYPENAESYDTMMNSAERCAEIFATPILWRPVGRSNCLTAKLIVTLAGLNCVEYGDLAAVVSSSVAMEAVAASQTAMTAVAASATARGAVTASSTALAALEQSPLISEVSASSFNGTSYTTVYTGLCFIVAARRSSGSNTFIFNNTYTGSSTTTGASSAKTIGATNSAINLFATGIVVKLESSNSPSSNAIYFRIIKCG